jgi:2',3'-cyclic-nucleotide 2'-phosphodiesterase (5'-nucleotidase family)
MIEQIFFAIGFLPVVLGAQPQSPKPVEFPMRDLQWGQLNFLATTDIHGWYGGHLQEYLCFHL